MSDSTDIIDTLCTIIPNQFVVFSSQYLTQVHIQILRLAYFWLLIIASSTEFITLILFCVKVYLLRKDSMATPILSALFTQSVGSSNRACIQQMSLTIITGERHTT